MSAISLFYFPCPEGKNVSLNGPPRANLPRSPLAFDRAGNRQPVSLGANLLMEVVNQNNNVAICKSNYWYQKNVKGSVKPGGTAEPHYHFQQETHSFVNLNIDQSGLRKPVCRG